MNKSIKLIAPLAFAILVFASSCSEKKTSQEKAEINTMDSTSKVLKENTEKLEDQTKKVEASVEELDEEFEAVK
jgi:septal ring factor EnvC (AmiA/AmiB activator)